MFPREIWFHPVWCLYDKMDGTTVLKYPYHRGAAVPCPHCGKTLSVEQYKAQCCGYNFRVSFNEISQAEPVGTHDKRYGRGWESLRPYNPDE